MQRVRPIASPGKLSDEHTMDDDFFGGLMSQVINSTSLQQRKRPATGGAGDENSRFRQEPRIS
jgi:hypothetical protein